MKKIFWSGSCMVSDIQIFVALGLALIALALAIRLGTALY